MDTSYGVTSLDVGPTRAWFNVAGLDILGTGGETLNIQGYYKYYLDRFYTAVNAVDEHGAQVRRDWLCLWRRPRIQETEPILGRVLQLLVQHHRALQSRRRRTRPLEPDGSRVRSNGTCPPTKWSTPSTST